MLTLSNTLGELYSTPVGQDLLNKVLMQMGVSERILANPLVSRMKLSAVDALAAKKFGAGFMEDLLELVNRETESVKAAHGNIRPAWWKEAVFYQIYPRSFKDSNGDGIGDLNGILEKLDYLKDLGVDALWLSPVYDSPNDDNGYDIRDYRKIMREFGTMEDFDRLLEAVHARGMRLIMDLVVNHTSDEHAWFRKALSQPDSPEAGYYYLLPGEDDDPPPNNWTSFFSGPAWNYYPDQKLWGLHLFSRKQMDLNWENPSLRREIIDMIRWWLEKGVDGFRMDVINYISKAPGLPDGNEAIGQMMGFYGVEHYIYGPRLHAFLRQIRREAFDGYQAFSIGEAPGLGMNMSRMITAVERHELDMVFCFDHLETPGHVRMDDYEYDLNFFREHIVNWIRNYGSNCQLSLFYNNHDNPRMISKVCPDPAYQEALAQLLAALQLTLPGTPFLFQGDEMGLANYEFTSLTQITDVEAQGFCREHPEMTEEELLRKLTPGTREHARIPLPWNETVPACYAGLRQEPHPAVLAAYQTLLRIRKGDRCFAYGDFELLNGKKDRFVYRRRLEGRSYVVEANLGRKTIRAFFPGIGKKLLFSNFSEAVPGNKLPAYGVRIWKE